MPLMSLDHKGMGIESLGARLDKGDCAVPYVIHESMEAIEPCVEHVGMAYAGQSAPAAAQCGLPTYLSQK